MPNRMPTAPFSLDCLQDFPPVNTQASPSSSEIPCLLPNQTPNQTSTSSSTPPPHNPCLFSPDKKPDSEPLDPSPNVWKNKPPNLRQVLTKKIFLRFIPPSARGSGLVGICPTEAVVGELQILDLTLVGFFLGRKPGFSFVRTNLLKQWKIKGSVQMLQLIQGGLAFRFSDIEDRDLILETGVFYVGGQPIFIRSWERNIHTGGILGLKQIPLWVSLPGLPLHLWGEDSLSAICSVLGKPLYSDRITAEKSRWSFARACVEFSAASPLLDSITIEDDVGNVFQQPVKYDWKPPHCFSCGIFGHLNGSCKSSPGEDEHGSEDAYTTSNQKIYMRNETTPSQEKEEENSEIEQDVGKDAKPDHSNLGKGTTFTELLQKRPSMLLWGWNPILVKKTGSALHEPTRIRKPFKTQVQKSDQSQPSEHVSKFGASSCGPTPCYLEKDAQSNPLSSPPYLEKNSNFKQAATFIPPLTNRFGILGLEEDISPCPQPIEMSLSDCGSDLGVVQEAYSSLASNGKPCEGMSRDVSCSSQLCEQQSIGGLDPGQVVRADQWQAEGLRPVFGKGNPPCEGRNMNRTKKPSTYYSPSSPKPGQSLPSNGTDSSSVGRTPYHSRFSKLISPYKSKPELINQSRNRQLLDPNDADIEQRVAPIPKPWFDKGQGNPMSESHLNYADATDEDIQENIEEEENEIEKDDKDDSTEEDDDQSGRDKEEEDAEKKRKRLIEVEKDGDPWLITTNLSDPRRIRFC